MVSDVASGFTGSDVGCKALCSLSGIVPPISPSLLDLSRLL